MRVFGRWTVSALLCACAAPTMVDPSPATTVELPISTAASVTGADVATSPPRRGARDEITVKLPPEVACTFTSTRHSFDATLAFSETGPAYVRLSGTVSSLSASLPVGPGPRGWAADVETGGVLFRGYTTAEGIELHPNAGVVFGDLFIPNGFMTVTIRKAERDRLSVAVPVPPSLETSSPELEATSSCGSFGVDHGFFEGRAAIGAPPGSPGTLHGKRVGLSVTEAGPVVAYAKLDAKTERWVEILEKGKKKTRIRWPIPEGLVVGWVEKGSVSRRSTEDELGTGGLGLTGIGAGGVPETIWCSHPVPLHAEAAGVEETVGIVRAETLMVPGVKSPGRLEVGFIDGTINSVDGAVLFVEPQAVADCTLQ